MSLVARVPSLTPTPTSPPKELVQTSYQRVPNLTPRSHLRVSPDHVLVASRAPSATPFQPQACCPLGLYTGNSLTHLRSQGLGKQIRLLAWLVVLRTSDKQDWRVLTGYSAGKASAGLFLILQKVRALVVEGHQEVW